MTTPVCGFITRTMPSPQHARRNLRACPKGSFCFKKTEGRLRQQRWRHTANHEQLKFSLCDHPALSSSAKQLLEVDTTGAYSSTATYHAATTHTATQTVRNNSKLMLTSTSSKHKRGYSWGSVSEIDAACCCCCIAAVAAVLLDSCLHIAPSNIRTGETDADSLRSHRQSARKIGTPHEKSKFVVGEASLAGTVLLLHSSYRCIDTRSANFL